MSKSNKKGVVVLYMINIRKNILSIVPIQWQRYYRILKKKYIAYISLRRNKRNQKRLANLRGVYNVLFFLESVSLWKYRSLYELFERSTYFHPIIIVCPNVLKLHDDMVRGMQSAYCELTKQGYRVLMGYNVEDRLYINVRTLNPHIVFFTSAWENYLDKRFHIDQFSDILTCYMNYGYATTPYEWSFVTQVSLRAWRYFQECNDYKIMLQQWVTGKNALVTGSPMYEAFMTLKAAGKDWKIGDSRLKRVIYAPHHSISEIADGLYGLSTFLIHYETMLEIAEQYKDSVQFVFKPHPLLRNHLYAHSQWGKDKTDLYYGRWENAVNTNFVNGEYIDLFNTSDALIHDCSSFTMEYLYVKKPALFLSNMGHEGQANKVAMRAYEAHYKAKTKAEICAFIDDVVLKGIDPKKSERDAFYNDVLLPPNGRSASENIFYEIANSLGVDKVVVNANL